MNNNQNTMGFYAVIPSFVLEADIEPNAKLLYGHISALCNREGLCWATNAYFANKFAKRGAPVDVRTIRRWVDSLVNNGFIVRNVQFDEDGVTVLRRCLSIPFMPVPTSGQNCPEGNDKNAPRGGDKNVPKNITSMNNTSDNYKDIDDVVYSQSRPREEKPKIDVEKWITRNIRAIKSPQLQVIVHNACFKSTDVLEYVVDVLNELLTSNETIVIKGEMYTPDDIASLITKMSQDTFMSLTQGFYTVDEETHNYIRKHVTDPVAYIMTVLKNQRDKPLKKIGNM